MAKIVIAGAGVGALAIHRLRREPVIPDFKRTAKIAWCAAMMGRRLIDPQFIPYHQLRRSFRHDY